MRLIRRKSLSRLVPLVLVSSLVASTAWAAVQRERLLATSTQALGTFSVYDYSSGVQTIRDTGVDWESGTYVDTQKTPSGGSVRLTRRGDFAPDPVNVWWDTTWRTRRCWAVSNATAAPITSGRATLTFDASLDVSNAWMQPGGVDVRALTGGAAPVLLNFTAAAFMAATATYTVEVPSLAAGASQTICLYWGNPAAVSASTVLAAPAGAPLYRLASGTNVADPTGNWVSHTPTLPAGVTSTSSVGNSFQVNPVISPPAMTTPYLPGPPAVPASTPSGVFTNITRVQQTGNNDFYQWQFAVPAATTVEVRLFVVDEGLNVRSYDVAVDGLVFLTNFNPPLLCTTAGLSNTCGMMRSFSAVSDGSVDVRFSRGNGTSGAGRRQLWSAIEIRTAPPAIVALTARGEQQRLGE